MAIGCGDGRDLICQALNWPQSSYVGIDIDADKINAGNKVISEAGIANIELFTIDLQDLLNSEPGKFDYIIIHDIFALLDKGAREALLSFCEQHLTENGILAVKWNVLPGAQITDTLRSAIALHTQYAESEEKKIVSARSMLKYMATATADETLQMHIKEAQALSDAELALRYLYSGNDACYFTEFNQLLRNSNLQYVGDIVSQFELAESYGSKVSAVHKAVAEVRDAITAQQYLDFAVGRQRRFSIMISQNAQSAISPKPLMEPLKDLYWAGNFQRSDEKVAHSNQQGEFLNTKNELLKRILDVIGDCWPLNISTRQIIQNTLRPEEPEGHAEEVLKTLEALYLKNIPGIYLSAEASPYNRSTHSSLRPICKIPDEAFAEQEYIELFNFWGESVTLTRAEYGYLLAGLPVENEEDYRQLSELINKGLLTGADIAWLKVFQKGIALKNITITQRNARKFILFSSSEKQGGFKKENAEGKKTKSISRHGCEKRLIEKIKAMFLREQKQDALALAHDLLNKYPRDAELRDVIANLYFRLDKPEECLDVVSEAFGLDGVSKECLYFLARLLVKKSDTYFSPAFVQHLLRAHPGDAKLWDLLSHIYADKKDTVKAEFCARKAVELCGNHHTYLMQLGNILSGNFQMQEARYYLKKGLDLAESSTDYYTCYTNLLFVSIHDSTLSPQEIRAEHEQFGLKAAQWVKKQTLPERKITSERSSQRLRIGFVSGDFRNHPVSNFISPIWHAIDREKFEIVAFNNSPENDNATNLLKSTATGWHDIRALNHVELAALIANEQIDILIDLSGHTSHNRLLTFALKPAPVQMSWIGYPGTTGLREMDYYIIDAHFAPPGLLDDQFTEKLAYLPPIKQFEPSILSPKVDALPALKNGYITFCSFNRPQKITSEALDCWGAILRKLPDAKLVLASMTDNKMIGYFTDELVARGAKPEQIIGRLKTNFIAYLAMHGEVDVMLDTFPYTGGTTIQHASWMGVPTLTLTGETVVSRQGSAAMAFVGLHDFIVGSQEDYIAKAVAFNERYDYLSSVRLNMRNRILERERNVGSMAFYFEKLLERAWRQYKQGLAAEPIMIETE